MPPEGPVPFSKRVPDPETRQLERRLVWRANTKLGTVPMGMGYFYDEPVVGLVTWWVEDFGALETHEPPRRVLIDRVDLEVDRVFCSLL